MRDIKINPLDFENDVAIGLNIPMNNSTGGFKQNYLTKDQIHANFKNLILTNKGERIMHPTFGSTIYELLFEPSVDGDVSSAALDSIRDAAKEWMPFITVQDTFVTFNESTANIKVSYSIKELDIIEILEMNIRI